MNVKVNVNMVGLDEVREAVGAVHSCLEALEKSLFELEKAVHKIGVEINQPTAGTDG